MPTPTLPTGAVSGSAAARGGAGAGVPAGAAGPAEASAAASPAATAANDGAAASATGSPPASATGTPSAALPSTVAGAAGAPPAAPTPRDDVLQRYRQTLLPAFDVPLGWTGSVGGCVAGETRADHRQATLAVVNYYRELAGLAPVVLDAVLSAKSQWGALMFAADPRVTHHPTPDWACYTADGAEAAAHGNLAWGTDAEGALSGPGAVRAYLADTDKPGVGHRRWLLLPGLARVGTGDTPNTNVLWVVSDPASGPASPPPPEGVAWPPRGLVPWSARVARPSDRWSLELYGQDADFTAATVRMTDGAGGAVAVQPTPQSDRGLIVWQTVASEAEWARLAGDATFHVVIDGVRVGGEPRRFEYDVTFVRP